MKSMWFCDVTSCGLLGTPRLELRSRRFGTSRNWIHILSAILYTYVLCVALNSNSNTLQPDRPLHYPNAACFIAHQYSASIFISLLFFYSRKGEKGRAFENFSIFTFLKFVIGGVFVTKIFPTSAKLQGDHTPEARDFCKVTLQELKIQHY